MFIKKKHNGENMINVQELQSAINQQAKFINKIEYKDLSDEIIQSAKLILLDSIGCIAAGTKQYNLNRIEKGNYTVIGIGKTAREDAIFFNGSAMVKNELDEGNQFAFGHPACHIIPALLSEMQHDKYTGKEVLTAVVAAYETSCRWGASAKIKPAMHVHGTMQTMGATAAICKLCKCTDEEIATAIITANSMPQATSWSAAFMGDQLRNAYIGISNVLGLKAYYINQAGIKSSIDTLESVWYQVLDGSIDTKGLYQNLGSDFYIEKNYFKQYSTCRYIHGFVDILKDFTIQGLKVEDIKMISVETYKAASKLDKQNVKNSFAMRFSIPVSLAVFMVYGSLDIENITDEHIQNMDVINLASKINVKENHDFTEKLPHIRENKIVIDTYSGECYEKNSKITKGDYLDPFHVDDIVNKFHKITSNIWLEDRRNQICNYILTIEQQEDTSKCFELLDKV